MDCSPPGLPVPYWSCPWNSPGKHTGVGSHSLLQGIFLSQESNPRLLHCRQIIYSPSHQGSPIVLNPEYIKNSYKTITKRNNSNNCLKHMKRRWTSLINHEGSTNQTIMSYHFSPIRMTTTEKKKKNKCWQECGHIGALVQCWWWFKMVQLPLKIKYGVSSKN